jgi:hypothetical protein
VNKDFRIALWHCPLGATFRTFHIPGTTDVVTCAIYREDEATFSIGFSFYPRTVWKKKRRFAAWKRTMHKPLFIPDNKKETIIQALIIEAERLKISSINDENKEFIF